MSNNNMSFSNNRSALLEVASRYKEEQGQPSGFFSEIIHYHDKNPDANLQIKLLEESDKFIKNIADSREQNIAQLGMLLILRDLLIDPNREDQIFSYLIEKLDLDNTINSILKKISLGMVFDLTDSKFLALGKQAINIGQTILDSEVLRSALPNDFSKEIKKIIFAENDYTDKVLNTLEVSRKP